MMSRRTDQLEQLRRDDPETYDDMAAEEAERAGMCRECGEHYTACACHTLPDNGPAHGPACMCMDCMTPAGTPAQPIDWRTE